MTAIKLPVRCRGRMSAAARAIYDADAQAFCDALMEIASTLDFKMSVRGWCYYLESYGLTKGDFDKAQDLINDCRKSGLLPIDFTAKDSARQAENLEILDGIGPEEYAQAVFDYVARAHHGYTPLSAWDHQDVYVEVFVEKTDLRGLFGPVCAEYNIPIANARGWSDINSRADMMERFAHWERQGKQCVLLYCGDFDPGGLIISDALRSNMADLADAVGWSPRSLIIDRIGLNRDYIDAHGLTWVENLITGSNKNLADPRHKDHHKRYVRDYLKANCARKVEANAMVADVDATRELCRNAILKYINEDSVQSYRDELAARRDLVRVEIERRLA